jgi:hypothetical protein
VKAYQDIDYYLDNGRRRRYYRQTETRHVLRLFGYLLTRSGRTYACDILPREWKLKEVISEFFYWNNKTYQLHTRELKLVDWE